MSAQKYVEPEHSADGWCWCNPSVQQVGDTVVVVHHSLISIIMENGEVVADAPSPPGMSSHFVMAAEWMGRIL